MNITVFGAGYVGLVVAACFADVGHQVIVVDVNAERVSALNEGILPIYEPGLQELVAALQAEGRLLFTQSVSQGLENANLAFIAVGTPEKEDGSADCQHVLSVAKTIGENVQNDLIVVQKSTVPVGTSEQIETAIRESLEQRESSIQVHIVSNPEFLREGHALEDFQCADRVVIGTDSAEVANFMQSLYEPFCQKGAFLSISRRSAEIAKYAANAMLATKISFINEIANLCEKVGADVLEVRQGMALDHRIGPHFITPGPGYGGSCFPKDVSALYTTAKAHTLEMPLLKACMKTNELQKQTAFKKLQTYYGNALPDKIISVWGLAFKADTDDVRESPALSLIRSLDASGCRIQAYDPKATETTKRALGDCAALYYASDMISALEGADALVIMTEWPVFRSATPEMLSVLTDKLIIDARNLLAQKQWEGFDYIGLGRKTSLLTQAQESITC